MQNFNIVLQIPTFNLYLYLKKHNSGEKNSTLFILFAILIFTAMEHLLRRKKRVIKPLQLHVRRYLESNLESAKRPKTLVRRQNKKRECN